MKIKKFEDFEYMWDNPDYFKNFLQVGDYIVITNKDDGIRNKEAQIVKICRRDDYPEYNIGCEFITCLDIGCVVGGDGIYYVSYKEIVRKLKDYEVAALKYNL